MSGKTWEWILRLAGFIFIAALSKAIAKSRKVNMTLTTAEGQVVYRWPQYFTYLGILCALLGVAAFSAMIYVYLYGTGESAPDIDPEKVILTGIFCFAFLFFGWLVYICLRFRYCKVFTDAKGITEVRNGRPIYLEWNQIVNLKGRPTIGSLLVTGNNGTILKIGYNLINYRKLFDEILDRVNISIGTVVFPMKFGSKNFRIHAKIILVVLLLALIFMRRISTQHPSAFAMEGKRLKASKQNPQIPFRHRGLTFPRTLTISPPEVSPILPNWS